MKFIQAFDSTAVQKMDADRAAYPDNDRFFVIQSEKKKFTFPSSVHPSSEIRNVGHVCEQV